nr:hypothetical protein [uncultured Actinoplanes sp.]
MSFKPKMLLGFTLGTLSAIGGFIDIGDLVADALVGARSDYAWPGSPFWQSSASCVTPRCPPASR